MMFELGLVVLKSMKDIYETKTEERILIKDDNTTETNTGDSKKASNSSDRVTGT